MTNGSSQQSELSPREERLSRRVSSLNIARPNLSDSSSSSEGEPSPKATPERHHLPPASGLLTRQVSHDGLNSLAEKENDKKLPAASGSGRASPIRCVTEFDKVSLSFKSGCQESPAKATLPLVASRSQLGRHNRKLLSQHKASLRIEANLHPMRLILFRLMTNIHYNRKGIFNVPVDPIALGLVDYTKIVTHPMDLGTVKNRLHAVSYQSRRQVADDIRLCFRNAMLYSPPHNLVHISAKELLVFFEDQVACFCPDLVPSEQPLPTLESSYDVPGTAIAQVSFSSMNECGACSSNDDETMVESDSPQTLARLESTDDPKSLDEPAPWFPVTLAVQKRKKRGSKSMEGHNCQWCNGNICAICDQGCLALEPTLLICNGPHCVGIKVRKGATYFVAPDGSFQYCQRCYAGLSAVLPQSGKQEVDACRYKRNLLKRKNDEETAEQWITCSRCQSAVHRMCVMFNPYIHDEATFCCPSCDVGTEEPLDLDAPPEDADLHTFVAGSNHLVPMSNFAGGSFRLGDEFTAEALRETSVSAFIQAKVRECMMSADNPNAEKTVVVRIISECERYFKVPEVIRKHFHMHTKVEAESHVVPPSKVMYRSKAIALFQKHDGLDVCIFCMYVQEYNADNDEFETADDKDSAKQQKRVYIAYLDSVDHFRPRECRTRVYQEVLTAYLASARMRGYEAAHIWACPPSRGNSFVFNNHPAAQRTPNMERLTAWYHSAIGRAMDCGVVTDVKSLYESDFQESMNRIESSDSKTPVTMTCPPLFEGDFWIEEALRVHSIALSRCSKDTATNTGSDDTLLANDANRSCPALQVAALIRDKIVAHPSSVAFRRPVNAAALNLKDYHRIISKPMDLGTVHSRCVLGEYNQLKDLVADMDLIWANAMTFNPPGHVVHVAATLVRDLFLAELNETTKSWATETSAHHTWNQLEETSLSLDTSLHGGELLVEGNSTTQSILAAPAVPAGKNSAIEPPSSDDVPATVPAISSIDASKDRPLPAIDSEPSSCGTVASTNVTSIGPAAVRELMVGSDTWLLDKKNPVPPKGLLPAKKCKRGRRSSDLSEEPASKRRRQTWLGEEVGAAVRRMRTSFFKCLLVSDSADSQCDDKLDNFERYAKGFVNDDSVLRSSRVADARHALLEFSQFRSLEFDTLRRAKYSSAILLYYLHNEGAPGVIPECTGCAKPIEGVRWHRLHRVIQRRPVATVPSHVGRKRKVDCSDSDGSEAELCASCYAQQPDPDVFIPLQVSI